MAMVMVITMATMMIVILLIMKMMVKTTTAGRHQQYKKHSKTITKMCELRPPLLSHDNERTTAIMKMMKTVGDYNNIFETATCF